MARLCKPSTIMTSSQKLLRGFLNNRHSSNVDMTWSNPQACHTELSLYNSYSISGNFLKYCISWLFQQGIPGRDQGHATGPDAVVPPVSGAPAVSAGGITVPANTGSSPSAGGGKRMVLCCMFTSASMSKCLSRLLSSCVHLFVASHIFWLILHPLREPPEFPKKSAPVPRDATVDPAECCSASCAAAGDWQGKPWAVAGKALTELDRC